MNLTMCRVKLLPAFAFLWNGTVLVSVCVVRALKQMVVLWCTVYNWVKSVRKSRVCQIHFFFVHCVRQTFDLVTSC